ncbi:MAG: 6,7-dimethyl-8-ribityllumazine synthase [Tannerella sp.]|jgi:6,7-dimethyl-8-ribityllumazine synthase|nr:6,7-dimethyl-8-ribityllumazine synthase [Tannerella sp.]
MATAYHNLSEYDPNTVPDATGMRFSVVVSEWNRPVTEHLLEGAVNTLERCGALPENIFVSHVPGSFELTFGALKAAEREQPDAVIVLGCVIRGETPHFDYVCSAVTQGMVELNLRGKIPFLFGLLTTNTLQQAEARSGGKLGNKGDEAAITAIKMAQYNRKVEN